jgi:hypothetical protein
MVSTARRLMLQDLWLKGHQRHIDHGRKGALALAALRDDASNTGLDRDAFLTATINNKIIIYASCPRDVPVFW